MKKFLAAVVVILVAAGLGAPFASGLVAERQFREKVDKINKLYGDAALGITVDITRYDRGFSSSEVEWKLNLGKMSAFYGVKDVVLYDRVQHEMTGVVVETTLTKNPKYEEIVKNRLAGKDPLHITSRYSLSGELTTTATLDAFVVNVDGQTLEVKPARMVTTVDKELKHFASEGTWEGVAMNGVGSVDGVSMKSDLTMETIYLWNGTAAMVAKSGRVEDVNGPFSLDNLKIKYVSEYDKGNNKLAGKVEYGADKLVAGEKKVENAFVRLAMKGINASVYEELMRQYLAAFNKILADTGVNAQDPEQWEKALEQQMGQIGMQLMGTAEKLLANGLEFQISDLRFTLPEGEVKGGLRVGLNKDMTFVQFIPLANQPELALQIFSLQSNCSLPKQLLGGDPALLEPAFPGMQTGLFVEKGQWAEHKTEIKDGKLLLNDNVVQMQ